MTFNRSRYASRIARGMMRDAVTFQRFADALRHHIASGTNGITSQGKLARRLAELHPTRKNEESWRRQILRWLAPSDPDEPEEASISLVAKAFGMRRDAWPRRWTLERQVEELRAELDALRRRLEANERGSR